MSAELEHQLDELRAVSLEQLDERASLLRRVDRKYSVAADHMFELLDRLRDDHQVLEIDGRRCFNYQTVYFETPDLRCFRDHVDGRAPRFKARTRLYEDTGSCVFEVKLKRPSGEMDKRQVDHPAEEADQITDQAVQCLREALQDARLDVPGDLTPALMTRFRRFTLAARTNAERLTCDLRVRLSSPTGGTAELVESSILVESKTEDGQGRLDRMLAEMGIEEISLSKYRVGMSLVGPARTDEPQPGSELFELV